MDCAEVRDLLAALADSQLDGESRRAADEHLAGCANCTALLERERRFAVALRKKLPISPAPAPLRARVVAAIEAERAPVTPQPTLWLDRLAALWTQPRYRWAMAAAAVALMVVTLVPLLRGPAAISLDEVAAHYQAIASGDLSLAMQTDDVAALKAFYRQSEGFEFDHTLMDFSAQGFRVLGGGVSRLGPYRVTQTVYEGPSGRMLCHRFLARDFADPPGGEAHGNMRIYTVNGITICLIRDGDVICLLATRMPKDEFVRTMAHA